MATAMRKINNILWCSEVQYRHLNIKKYMSTVNMKTIHLITMLKLIGWMCGNDVNFKEDLYIYKILIYYSSSLPK